MSDAAAPAAFSRELARELEDSRRRTLDLVADLTDDELELPMLKIVNPVLWELGHVAWFQEKWCLRRDGAGTPSIRDDTDALFDSAAVAHDTRWGLSLPSRNETLEYLGGVLDAVLERLGASPPSDEDAYFVRLSVGHEDMHGEAALMTRQTLGLRRPPRVVALPPPPRGAVVSGDARVPAGTWRVGAERGAEPFVFDNEKWAHDAELGAFRIARAPVTEREFAEFVASGGYARRELWTDEGWAWRVAASAERPIAWVPDGRSFLRRDFDRLVPLDGGLPVVNVSAHEAEAYCRSLGRRLPSEAEWEAAALGNSASSGTRRRFPWGDAPPTRERARLDALDRADVGALGAGDGPFGCRQMIGNVWEWTSTAFLPYPGFAPDPYAEYSAPWFGNHRVLRGGGFATRARLIRGTWRNFYTPDRRDVFAGFRTALDEPR